VSFEREVEVELRAVASGGAEEQPMQERDQSILAVNHFPNFGELFRDAKLQHVFFLTAGSIRLVRKHFDFITLSLRSEQYFLYF
jgi:hypothetical protein